MGKYEKKNSAEKKYNAAKALQAMGYSISQTSQALGISERTIGRYYRCKSFEDYKGIIKETNEYYRAKNEAKTAKQQEFVLEDEPKQNEIIMSRLELLGTPHEISLLAQIARKMGVIGKYTANAK